MASELEQRLDSAEHQVRWRGLDGAQEPEDEFLNWHQALTPEEHQALLALLRYTYRGGPAISEELHLCAGHAIIRLSEDESVLFLEDAIYALVQYELKAGVMTRDDVLRELGTDEGERVMDWARTDWCKFIRGLDDGYLQRRAGDGIVKES